MTSAISPGTRLGPYEILAPLGAGGMGEVYRARDTRLDRSVAVKILPAEFASNEQLRARFEREAKVISQFNHPHICVLYDLGVADVASGAPPLKSQAAQTGALTIAVPYIVMELIEGESLAERLARGPLPLDQVMRYGAEIAGALDRAHSADVVHRDLKPGNVMLTKSGAKLLDFGLAKNTGIDLNVDDATMQKPLTQEGTIVGTFQYMAPEQLEGEKTDYRSDLFALGALLYEMATGHRAFEGKTKTSLIAAIVTGEPRSMSEFQPLTPPAFEHVVKKCLAKDAEDRWQSARDVAEELRWIGAVGSQAGVAAPVSSRKRSRERLAWILAAVFAVLLAAMSAMLIPKVERASRPFVANIASPRGTRFNAIGDQGGPLVLSPDGTEAVYSVVDVNGDRLMLQSLLTGEVKAIPGTEGAQFPFWSPDSRKVGFFTAAHLERVDVAGGAPISLCDVAGARGGSWGADDTIIFTPNTQEPLYKVAASGGKPVVLTTIDSTQHSSHRWPTFLPDGKRFLYLACNHQDPTGSVNAIYLGSLDGTKPRLILRSISNALYAGGYLLFDRDQTLFAQKVKNDLSLDGEPVAIAQDALYDAGVWRAGFSVAQDGLLAYYAGRASSLSKLLWLDRHGTLIKSAGDTEAYWDVEISPNQEKLLVPVGDPMREIWIEDIQRNTRTKVTLRGWTNAAIWSHDGQTIYTDVLRDGNFDLVAKRMAGGETPLLRRKGVIQVQAVSADGKSLFLAATGVIERLPIDPPGKPVAIQTGKNALLPSISPNGKWLAYNSDENGRVEVFVQSLDEPDLKWQVSANGGTMPRWRGDGKEIYFIDLSNRLTATSVTENGKDLAFGAPEPLFTVNLRPAARAYDVTADGQKFIVNVLAEQDAPTVVVVKDWRTRVAQ